MEKLPQEVTHSALTFKSDVSQSFFKQEMHEFRDRAVYTSLDGESPFAKDSLAGEIFSQISHLSIKISASASKTYPYPPGTKGKFNIASDASEWKGPHFWKQPLSTSTDWYSKLMQLKSLTVLRCQDREELAPKWAK